MLCRKGLRTFFRAYLETSPFSFLRCYDSHTAVLGISSDKHGVRVRRQPCLVHRMLGAPAFKALLKPGLLISTHSNLVISQCFGLKSTWETHSLLWLFMLYASTELCIPPVLPILGFALPTVTEYLSISAEWTALSFGLSPTSDNTDSHEKH